MGNEAGLTQCFSNLLGNAVKFVKPGVRPQVRIWAERCEEGAGNPKEIRNPKSEDETAQRPGVVASSPATQHATRNTEHVPGITPSLHHSPTPLPLVRIWVEDKGIGIPEVMLPRVFDMFSRGHRYA